MVSRRRVINIIPVAGLVWLGGDGARASATRVEEQDPDAVAQDYRADASTIDAAKYPKYVAGRTCANCQLFDGGPKDAWAGCSLFLGREVAAKGWCSAWEKKAG
jgi:hypothetical protein